MRLSIKFKQMVGVTAIVGLAVVALSVVYATRLADVVVRESYSRGQLLAKAILQRAGSIVTGEGDPYAALREDPGLRAILQSSVYGEDVLTAAIVDANGVIVANNIRTYEGTTIKARPDLGKLVDEASLEKLKFLYGSDEQTIIEVQEQLKRGDEDFGSIRIGVSTTLMRGELDKLLWEALVIFAVAIGVAVFVAGILAQVLLRPIHVLRSGLTRLGKGEFGVSLDLPPGDEFGELGDFFNTVSPVSYTHLTLPTILRV